MSSAKELHLQQIKAIANAKGAPEDDKKYTVVDVRTKQEYEGGHIPSAINIPVSDFESYLKNPSSDFPKPNDPVNNLVLYCKSGMRTRKAKDAAESHGYKDNLYVYYGGWDEYGQLA
ncbi:Thiosulfate sulfurtransferase rdl2, mitochondrial [Spiromyces aspiralis]|uniref:Thiosulfate sulfurtransferase rdl2, mitochondrial n=1 Tax=Spiromyces aspiralis TaxID=68401 RepID=A0ACC1I1Q7_9FUNG|nr:Thiosulfate sulfurtransferase rdl2, mitochondrial [Spiromyces aspiralis]